MKIQLKNIGGIKSQAVEIKEGLNVIKAPNAVGKTSFTNGLKVATLNRNEISENPQFLNDTAKEGLVTIDNKSVRITRLTEDTLDVDGNPIYLANGKSELIFATPENDFLNQVIKGKEIEEFLTKVSDATYYTKVKNDYVEEVLDNCASRRKDEEEIVKRLSGKEVSIVKMEKDLDKKNQAHSKLTEQLNQIKQTEKDYDKHSKKSDELKDQKQKKVDENTEKKISINDLKVKIPIFEKTIKDLVKQDENIKTEYPDINKSIKETKDSKDKKELELKEISTSLAIEQRDLQRNKDILNQKSSHCGECGKSYSENDRKKRIEQLKQSVLNKTATKNSLTAEIKNLKNNYEYLLNDIKTKKRKITEELNSNKNGLKDAKNDIDRFTEIIKVNIEKIKELTTKIKEIEGQMNERVRDLRDKISISNAEIRGIEIELIHDRGSLKEYTRAKQEYEALDNKCKLLIEIKTYIDNEIVRLQKAVVKKFNERITEVYKILGFKNFDKIEIDDFSYKIKVTRNKQEQELNRLSTSERVTIGVIVMLAGKEEYLPDFPFFVLDEVTTAYDSVRFEKIINYVKEHTPYAIVTTFVPTGDEIKVDYKL